MRIEIPFHFRVSGFAVCTTWPPTLESGWNSHLNKLASCAHCRCQFTSEFPVLRLAHCGIHIRNLKGIHLYKPLVKHPQLLNFNRKSIGSLFFPVFVRKFAFLWTGLLFKVVFNAKKSPPFSRKMKN